MGTLRPRACTLPSNVYSTACTSQYVTDLGISTEYPKSRNSEVEVHDQKLHGVSFSNCKSTDLFILRTVVQIYILKLYKDLPFPHVKKVIVYRNF
jgi:hypothetical protein